MSNHLQAKKSLGQHFLTSVGAIEAMVKAGGVSKDDTVLEIGPGKGVLTRALLATGAHVIAVEKDNQLIPFLEEKFEKEIKSGNLEIIHGDILNQNISDIIENKIGLRQMDAVQGGVFKRRGAVVSYGDEHFRHSNKEMRHMRKSYKLVANIPYYITGEIIRLFLTTEYKPESMTLLVQKEVAERIVVKDGKESVLSLSVKFFGTPSYIKTVKRGSFNPPPNVDSAILHVDLKQSLEILDMRYDGKNKKNLEEKFFKLIKTGFKSKRKKLISNLSALYDKSALADTFEKLNLSHNTRAEDVEINEWIKLCEFLN